MAKYLKRLSARLAREKLRESTASGKHWIVTKKIILEAETEDDELDITLDQGDTVEIGSTEDGDLALDTQAAVVVISDEDLASKIADLVVSSDELSDVKFVDKPALDAVMDDESVEDVIDDLADDSEEDTTGTEEDITVDIEDPNTNNVEVAEVDVEQKESVEAKFAKFIENTIKAKKYAFCESILVDEDASTTLRLRKIKGKSAKKESFNDYAAFTKRVSELNGSIKPGKIEIALTEAGDIMGGYDTELNDGEIYPENSFDSVSEMAEFDDEGDSLMDEMDFSADFTDDNSDMEMDVDVDEVVESVLKKYEESSKTGKDYVEMTKALAKAKLKESTIAKIAGSFDKKALKECVRVFDNKYGKFVAAFTESNDANNFICESADEKRFSKRFFS